MVNVVFHTAFLGDLLLAIPFLRQIKRKWPSEPLILVCRPGLGDFFLKNQLVDQIYEIDKKQDSSLVDFLAFISKYKIQYLFCPHQSFRSAWILSKVEAVKKIAFEKWWNKPFFNIFVNRDKNFPEPLRVLSLLAPLDEELQLRLAKFKSDPNYLNSKTRAEISAWPHHLSTDLLLTTEPPPERVQEIAKKLKLQRPYAVIAPSSQWATKRWTTAGFVELVHLLSERALNVYIVGTKQEAAHCKEVEHLASALAGRVDVRSFAGQTDLLELHALLFHAEVVIANDSGPMHMAAVAGRPVVAIFGPTTLDLGYRPWTDWSYVSQVNLSCRPCGKHGHNSCPIQTHDCMKKISANNVIFGVDQLRRRAPPAGAVSPSQTY